MSVPLDGISAGLIFPVRCLHVLPDLFDYILHKSLPYLILQTRVFSYSFTQEETTLLEKTETLHLVCVIH